MTNTMIEKGNEQNEDGENRESSGSDTDESQNEGLDIEFG